MKGTSLDASAMVWKPWGRIMEAASLQLLENYLLAILL